MTRPESIARVKWVRFVVGILTGLVAGRLLVEADRLLPTVVIDRIGHAVAGSDLLRAAIEQLPLGQSGIDSVHAWVIVIAIAIIPIVLIALVACVANLWAGHARAVIYASMVVPLFMAGAALYYHYRLALVDPRLAQSFWSNAGGNAQFYIVSVMLFVPIFVVLQRATRRIQQD